MPADVLFRVDLPHGLCVGVRVPSTIEPADVRTLPEEEQAFLHNLSPARKSTWLAGRIALHEALRDLGLDDGAVLVTSRGAPDLPDGVTASISHKRTLAVALAAPDAHGLTVGVDIEPVPGLPALLAQPDWNSRPDISSRVMTAEELALLAGLPEPQRRREVILTFSIKEALYKALNPIIGRYVSFQEATALPHGDGTVVVKLALAKQEGPFVAEARWSEIEGHLLTTATVKTA